MHGKAVKEHKRDVLTESLQLSNFIEKMLLNDDYEFMMCSNRRLIDLNLPFHIQK